jgi:hypothetical protein
MNEYKVMTSMSMLAANNAISNGGGLIVVAAW